MHQSRRGSHPTSRTTLSDGVARRGGWVVLAWVAVIAGLNIAVPQLEAVIARDSTSFVPEDAPSMEAYAAMDRAFGNGRSRSVVFAVAQRDSGLTTADKTWVRQLATRLDRDKRVSSVPDLSRPGLLDALVSKDGQAVYLQVGLPGYTGGPPAARELAFVRAAVDRGRPAGLDVAVTGPPATIADMQHQIEHSILRITIVTLGLIAIILMLIYRSIAVTAVVLGFIGASLGASRALVAWSGEHLFDVSTFTASFLTAVVLGAATDYAIFMLSRYHELRRAGMEPRDAVALASRKVGSVIIGSALTVVLASATMLLAEVGIFRTTGPAVAVGVAVTLALSMTLLPAMMALAGSRGWLDPRPARSEARWAALSALVVGRPGRVLVAGLIPLALLAAFYPLLQPTFDERSNQSDGTESNVGYALMAAHYPANEVTGDYLLITADHDLRNPRDLAALEQAAANVARTQGVASVRAVTRPLGLPIRQASLSYQFARAGTALGGAADRVGVGADHSQALVAGAGQLKDGAGRLAGGADLAVDGAGHLLGGVQQLADGIDRLHAGAGQARVGARLLRAGALALAAGLDSGYAQARRAVDGLGLAYDALSQSLTCGVDPYCSRARDGIRQIYTGERDQLLPGLRQAADAARRIATGAGSLQDGLTQLQSGLDRASAGADRVAQGQQTMRDKLGQLADGADQLVAGSQRIEGGTQQVSGAMGQLGDGLTRAASYLRTTGTRSAGPAMSGFYLPTRALDDPRFALAKGLFLSADGRQARMIVLGSTDGFGNEAADRSRDIQAAAAEGLKGTRLADATVQSAGLPTVNADLARLSQGDFDLVAAVALLAVFLILLVLLRSVVAAAFLLATVALSYAAAIGLGVLVWQFWLDTPLDWTVPAIAFVLLVAVGADYNMLLMKRIHDEAPDGGAEGIGRALTVTGGVITSAGVIFAASMFAMLAGSVTTLAQIGFTIGMGLLLDTFVVRTLVVPSVATLLGRRVWWPSRA
jgi:RND superfamily putative drug exporter